MTMGKIMLNLTGKKFGKWTVLSISQKQHGKIYWKCQCDCGNIKDVVGDGLKRGTSKSCGCFPQLTGKKFGRWTVLSLFERKNGNIYWKCQCDCGLQKNIAAYSLINGNSKSCGCLLKEINSLPVGVAAMHAVHRNYTRTAKERNLQFTLTMQEFKELTSSNCYYCGSSPNQKIEKVDTPKNPMNGNYIYNGIDRVDNEQGYNFENCVPCCKFCNHAKSNRKQKDFFDWIEKIYLSHLSPNQGQNLRRIESNK